MLLFCLGSCCCCLHIHQLPIHTYRGALKNIKFTQALVDVIKEAGVAEGGCPKAQGNLLYTIASKVCV